MARAIRALVDGLPADDIAIDDRGMQYGHGMFETCRIVAGRIPLWSYHRARLAATALRLHIPLSLEPIDVEVTELAAACTDGVIKVLVTAGHGGRGYHGCRGYRGYRGNDYVARRVVAVFPPPQEIVDRGIGATVCLCKMRPATQPQLAGLKHLNRLEQVLACSERNDPGIAEGLMCDVDGRLIEGTATNLFLVRDGVSPPRTSTAAESPA